MICGNFFFIIYLLHSGFVGTMIFVVNLKHIVVKISKFPNQNIAVLKCYMIVTIWDFVSLIMHSTCSSQKITNGIAYLVIFDDLNLNPSSFAYIIVDNEHLMPAN